MSRSDASPEVTPTVFELIWEESEGHLFKSERHGVMAIADAFPKLPLQVVVAPATGLPGEEVRFSDLPRATKRKLHEVADAVEEKIAENITPEQRVITHTEGYGVRDHAHIVLFAAERHQGERLYTGTPLGPLAIQKTIELITFESVEVEVLEARLDQIQYLK